MNERSSAPYLGKSQQLAQELLARIAASDKEPGQTFATEAELLQQFDVSRPTLREGIRILESQGVLEQRPGPGGGLVIRRPSIEMLAHTVSIFLRFNHVPFITVLKAREVIEPALAAEAARRGTEEDFDQMAASIERMRNMGDDQIAFVAENREFHSIVARASRNEVLETFWGTISLLAHGEHHGVRYTFANRQHVITAHEQILEACRRRDVRAAVKAMSEHVGELEHLVRDHYQHLLEQPMRVRDRRR
ncbi:FadR/GntR family transcriptional regulator [Cupriavidus alkaliphilus]|uniref:FadR/GntR family transcriptional regulator n=1 Tax=Cupriavidus alkaliphilus TaxID=942866 RepID=UPI00160AB835|nr:FCD domain-containing protein [Cupriavidus alkaliphilus]MBB3014059.1 DNA-binding FadR family transcriptional regulator [Cupriavidus alkaliphilus]